MSENVPTSPDPARRKIPLLPAILILLLLGIAFFGNRGILRVMQLRRQRASLQKQVQSLEATNAGLRQEIKALRSDRRYIENIARREQGLVRPGELVYQFKNMPGPKETAGKTSRP